MDPQAFPILISLSKMIDELRKRIDEGNAKHQARSSALPTEPQTIDAKSNIGDMKAIKAALMNEVRIMQDDWLKAMESFYVVQECLLTLWLMVTPSHTPQQNVQGVFGLPVLLTNMKEELGQRIAEENAARLAEASIAALVLEDTDKITDVDALRLENTALKAELKTLGDGWMNMSAAFFALVKNLADTGLIMPTK
jgi:hypothetical protein